MFSLTILASFSPDTHLRDFPTPWRPHRQTLRTSVNILQAMRLRTWLLRLALWHRLRWFRQRTIWTWSTSFSLSNTWKLASHNWNRTMHRWKTMDSTPRVFKNLVWWPVQNMIKKLANFGRPYTPCNRLIKVWMHSLRRSPLHWQLSIDKLKKVKRSTTQCRLCWLHFEAWWINLAPTPHRPIGVVCSFVSHHTNFDLYGKQICWFPCCIAGAKLRTPIMLLTSWCTFLLVKLGSNMTSRLRSRHSRSPRGPNDIQYQLAQFPCGTHNPLERERVCREIQTEDIDFGDPHIACKERVIPENWQSAHQRTNEARQAHPIREQGSSQQCALNRPYYSTDVHSGQPPTQNTSERFITPTTWLHQLLSQHWRSRITWYHPGLSRCTYCYTWLEPKKALVTPPRLELLPKSTVLSHALSSLCWRRGRHHISVPSMCSTTPTGTKTSDYITNAFVKNIFINEDHRPAWIQPEEHMRVRLKCTTPVFLRKRFLLIVNVTDVAQGQA